MIGIVATAKKLGPVRERELNNFAANSSLVDDYLPNADRQLESPGPGAARIEIENSIVGFLFRKMAMAADNNRESCGFWIEVQLREIVKYIDANSFQLEHLSFRQFASPLALVDIAENGSDRGDFGKLFENFGNANVSSMNNVMGCPQGIDSRGTQYAMSVGDNADKNWISQFSVTDFSVFSTNF